MKKILIGIVILIIGISLYIIFNRNDLTLQEKIIIEDSSLNTKGTMTSIKEEVSKEEVSKEEVSKEEVSKEEVSKEEVSKEEVSKEEVSSGIRIATNTETTFYEEQIEALKNKDYTDKEEPIYQDNNQIFLNLDGEHKKISVGKDEYFRPNLSSDKTYLSYEDSNGIVIQNITDGSIKKFEDDASYVSWHPDKELIVYARVKDDGTVLTESNIYTYNISNNQETLLTGTENRILVNPIFSEDGNYVYVQEDNTDKVVAISVKK